MVPGWSSKLYGKACPGQLSQNTFYLYISMSASISIPLYVCVYVYIFYRRSLLDYNIEVTGVDSSVISGSQDTLLPAHLLPPSSP